MPESLNGAGDALHDKLRQKLQHILPNASEASRTRLLDIALSPDSPSEALAQQLLSEQCTPHEIHLALIYCRNTLLALSRGLPDKEREERRTQLLMHHDRLLLLLMRDIEAVHEQEEARLQNDLLREGHAHLLSRACNEWAHEQEIIIYNFYRELPVKHAAQLLHVGENSFTIAKEKGIITVFAASEKGETAFTRLPGSEFAVRLTVEDVTNKTVHLRYGEFSPIRREKRRQTRVLSSELFKIAIRDSRFRQWKGKVCDFSVSGLGLMFDSRVGLLPGDTLAFSMMLHGRALTGKGSVVWSKSYVGECRMGISLEYDLESNTRLKSEVRKREKQILGEIGMHGPPTCFLSA